MERSADVHRVMQGAAGTESEIATAVAVAERRGYRDAVAMVELIAGEHGSSRGMDAGTAADLRFATRVRSVVMKFIVGGWSGCARVSRVE